MFLVPTLVVMTTYSFLCLTILFQLLYITAVKSKSSAGTLSKSSPAINMKPKPTTPGVPSRPSPITAVRKTQNWTPPGKVSKS